MKKRKYYINNEVLYNEVAKCQRKKKNTNEISEMFLLIIKGLLKKNSYRGYSKADKDDMTANAIITCLNSVSKFNLEKDNPFAYFISIILNSFKYYLKRKYKYHNFKMDFYEEVYIQNNKQFVNEYKKDREDYENHEPKTIED